METGRTNVYEWQDQSSDGEELHKYSTIIRFSYACASFSIILTLFFCEPAPNITSLITHVYNLIYLKRPLYGESVFSRSCHRCQSQAPSSAMTSIQCRGLATRGVDSEPNNPTTRCHCILVILMSVGLNRATDPTIGFGSRPDVFVVDDRRVCPREVPPSFSKAVEIW